MACTVESGRFGPRRRHRARGAAAVADLLLVGHGSVGVVRLADRVVDRADRVPRPQRGAALTVLPLVLPPVVGGVALFYAFGRRGLVGQWLDHAFGFQLPFTVWAAILAETFVAMPFFILTVEGALRGLDTRYEDAAATYGAGRWTVMRRVTLPMIGPSIVAGLALTWARALGEFGATITFAGNFRGKTQTLPLAIYLAFENNDPAGIVLSIVLVAVSVLVLALVGSRVLSTRGQLPTPVS